MARRQAPHWPPLRPRSGREGIQSVIFLPLIPAQAGIQLLGPRLHGDERMMGGLDLAESSTTIPSSAVSYESSARRASMSLLIWVRMSRFGRICARCRSSEDKAMWVEIGLSRV